MTRYPYREPLALILLGNLVLSLSGCASVKMPSLPFANQAEENPYRGLDGANYASVAEETYHSVRRARAENAIVLQVIDEEAEVRLLPLPPAGKTVYVSNLLKETGVLDKLNFVEATLYRHSTDSINGIPMEVVMTRDGSSVRPESDYALQAGDRLLVQKAANPALQHLVDTLLGQ